MEDQRLSLIRIKGHYILKEKSTKHIYNNHELVYNLKLRKQKQNNKELLIHVYGEGNGSPFQYSCLENSMDGRAW